MRPAELLAAIESLDLRHQALLSEQAEAERRAHPDPEVRQVRQRRAALESEAQHQASEVKQLELEVAELSERVKAHEKAIYDGSVRHPADLQRRQHELVSLRAKVGGLEETELARMEAQERTAADLAEVTQRLAGREREVERQRSADRDQAGAIAAEIAQNLEQRGQLASSLTPAQLRTYDLTAARHRPAVAKVAGGTCSGCRLPLAPRLLHEARGDQLVACENCQRILLL
ncbi:MAG: zinc ribbon domain-containing protein [Candidatus Dormibacteria bacterium]